MNPKWQHQLLVAAAALFSGSAVFAQENAEDLRVFSFVGLAAGLIVLGIWIGQRDE